VHDLSLPPSRSPLYSCLAALIRHGPHEDTDGRALVVPGALLKHEGRLPAQDLHGRHVRLSPAGLDHPGRSPAGLPPATGSVRLPRRRCMRLTHSTTSGNTRSSSRLRSTTSSLASPRGNITYLPPSSVKRAADGRPARCQNPNTCEVKPYVCLATGTEHSSFSSVFAHRSDRAVRRHLRPVSAPEASSHRHWHFR
jgi:hypothetical protein